MLKRLAFRTVAVVGLLVLTPLAFSAPEGVVENAVCAQKANGETCKRELDAVCTDGTSWLWDYRLERTIP